MRWFTFNKSSNINSLFVFTYWTFISTKWENAWEKVYAKYIMPWKKLLYSKMESVFKEVISFKSWKQTSEWLAKYTNRTVKSIRSMLTYSKIKDWVIDFNSWIQVFDAIESHNVYWNIINEDWTINSFPIDQIIIGRSKKDTTNNKSGVCVLK